MRAVVSTEVTANERYFNWLVRNCATDEYIATHGKMLRHLLNTPFKVRNQRDVNRASDGVALRVKYTRDTLDLVDFNSLDCSVLELIAALAIRCEEDIMYDPEIGNRTCEWFFGMLKSLGLYSVTDELYDSEFVDFVVYRFMRGEYEPNGRGGLFTLAKQTPDSPDMRIPEIWYQMHWYLRQRLLDETNE